jgi:hypothetical protein
MEARRREAIQALHRGFPVVRSDIVLRLIDRGNITVATNSITDERITDLGGE